jgi:hypothetical protein
MFGVRPPFPTAEYRLSRTQTAGPFSRWTAFMAVLWLVVTAAGCSELAQSNQPMPATLPPYVQLAAAYLRAVFKDQVAYDRFEISSPRWVDSIKGWSWLTCMRFQDHGHVRSYTIFMQNDAVIDGRYSVETDACAVQAFTPFDVNKGVLGPITPSSQPALY